MNYQEMIERLRDEHIATCEKLVKERDGFKAAAETWSEAYFKENNHTLALTIAYETKLQKAMDALREIASEASVPVHTTWRDGVNFKKMYTSWRALAVKRIDRARTTLAELEGKEC